MLKNGSVWKNARSKLETISNECSGAYCYDAVGLRNGDAPAYSRTLVTVTVARCPPLHTITWPIRNFGFVLRTLKSHVHFPTRGKEVVTEK